MSKNNSIKNEFSFTGSRKWGFGEEAFSNTARACNARKRSDPTPAKMVFLPLMNASGLIAQKAAIVGI